MSAADLAALDHARQHLVFVQDYLASDAPDRTLLLDAVALRLASAVECVSNVSEEVRADVIPIARWRAMLGTRNRIAHAYQFVDSEKLIANAAMNAEELSGFIDVMVARGGGGE